MDDLLDPAIHLPIHPRPDMQANTTPAGQQLCRVLMPVYCHHTLRVLEDMLGGYAAFAAVDAAVVTRHR